MKRLLAAVLCVLLMCMPMTATAEESAPFWIFDAEGEETLADLLEEDAQPPWDEEVPVLADASALSVNAKSAILMDMTGKTVLFEQNSHEPLPIASVTKVMTLLLVMEAIDNGQLSYDDMVTCSTRASSMGGSQIWLKENETMSVRDLLKAAVIVSANDACAALAEHLCGTIEAFVAKMNARAAELGATDTQFVDCSGLSDDGHSSAYDIALMSTELMTKHPSITEYTTVWMDSLRNGQSELVNTNKLVRFYSGTTGLKTGTTAAAGSCLSATAQRDGLSLVAVVLGAPSTQDRFTGARNMLDFGFASYALYTPKAEDTAYTPVRVLHGTQETVTPAPVQTIGTLVEKSRQGEASARVEMAEDLEAPVEVGQIIGEMIVCLGEEELARYPVTAAEAVERMDFGRALYRLFGAMTVGVVV
ncbi:MAG: D-alanyl-D-alanine carboxypeptidase family protein [Acutalibacteraceae bacterium]